MPLWIPIAMMILGQTMQNRQTKAAAGRRTAEMRKGREKESAVEKDQRADVMDEASAYDPALRQEALDTKAAETAARIEDVLNANEVTTTGDVGVIPEKLIEQRAQSVRNKANTASILAALNSKTQAPEDTAFDEGQSMTDLIADSQARSHKLGRIGKTTNTLANLEGQTNSKAMMMAGIMQQLGMAMASGSIMSGLAAPAAGAGGVATGTAGPGVVNMSPVSYPPPDAFGTAGIV